MHKNNKITVFSHVLVWLVLFSMPYLLSYGQTQEINRIIAHFWIPLVFSAFIFYFNYFVLIDHFLFPKKMVQFILINTVIIAVFLFLKEYIEEIDELKQAEDLGIDEVEYAKRKDQIDGILDDLYWYDRKVFEICASGKSVAALSRETGISYYSLYNTYTNAKKHIKEQL